jgi:hypothetical protein
MAQTATFTLISAGSGVASGCQIELIGRSPSGGTPTCGRYLLSLQISFFKQGDYLRLLFLRDGLHLAAEPGDVLYT